jgi:predicted MFS family arabinose efflux permease
LRSHQQQGALQISLHIIIYFNNFPTLGLLWVNPHAPLAKVPKPTRHDFDFLRKPLFLIILLATIVQALAHCGPSVYLPSFALDMGLTANQGALLVSLLNLAQVIGQSLQGVLAYVL